MPEVARVLTLQSFVPKDQDAKLAIIDDASFFLRNTLNPDQIDAEPTPAETVVAIEKTAHDLGNAAGDLDSPAAVQARRLAGLLAALAKASPEVRDKAQHALIAPLITTLRQVRDLLTAEHGCRLEPVCCRVMAIVAWRRGCSWQPGIGCLRALAADAHQG